jgi:hypothetical protein
VRVPGAPAYDVRDVFLLTPDEKVPPKMSLTSTAHQLVTLASEGTEHSGNHESLSPYLTGGGAFVALMLLLWITTRFNRDR